MQSQHIMHVHSAPLGELTVYNAPARYIGECTHNLHYTCNIIYVQCVNTVCRAPPLHTVGAKCIAGARVACVELGGRSPRAPAMS